MEQLGIALTGVTAIFLSQCRQVRLQRWASVLGLIGQPFWFYAAWKAEQWGIFGLWFLYTFSWARGFWIAPRRAPRPA